MPKSSGDLADEIDEGYEPEDYYDYDSYISAIEEKYGSGVQVVEIDEDDPRFTVNSS